jgi:hypothetical protein
VVVAGLVGAEASVRAWPSWATSFPRSAPAPPRSAGRSGGRPRPPPGLHEALELPLRRLEPVLEGVDGQPRGGRLGGQELHEAAAKLGRIEDPPETLLDPVDDRRLEVEERDPEAIADGGPGGDVAPAHVVRDLPSLPCCAASSARELRPPRRPRMLLSAALAPRYRSTERPRRQPTVPPGRRRPATGRNVARSPAFVSVLTFVPHSAYVGPGALRPLHSARLVARSYGDFADNALGDTIHAKDGRLAVPPRPGFGVDPDPRASSRSCARPDLACCARGQIDNPHRRGVPWKATAPRCGVRRRPCHRETRWPRSARPS